MLPKILILMTIVLCAAGFVAWDMRGAPMSMIPKNAASNIASNTTPSQLSRAPDVTITALDGQAYTLHDFTGKTVLLNIWATWCAPCIIEFPDLLRIAQKRADDLVLITLSVDERPELIAPFLQKLPQDLQPVLQQSNVIMAFDTNKSISQDVFQTIRYPETYVIGPRGHIIRKIAGALTDEDIQSLLANK